jgi:hypothetical protein
MTPHNPYTKMKSLTRAFQRIKNRSKRDSKEIFVLVLLDHGGGLTESGGKSESEE